VLALCTVFRDLLGSVGKRPSGKLGRVLQSFYKLDEPALIIWHGGIAIDAWKDDFV